MGGRERDCGVGAEKERGRGESDREGRVGEGKRERGSEKGE